MIGGGSGASQSPRAGAERSAAIVERGSDRTAPGTGLYLIGSATRALQALGVADDAARNGCVIRTQTLFNHRGTRLAEIDAEGRLTSRLLVGFLTWSKAIPSYWASPHVSTAGGDHSTGLAAVAVWLARRKTSSM